MDSMATIGFITAGLAILALVRLLAAFRELRDELLAQRERLNDGLQRLCTSERTLEQIGQGMPEIDGLLQRIEQAEKRALNPRYEEAARLVRGGAQDGKLATRCGLSRGEARLVEAMWRAETVSRDAAAVDRTVT